MVRLGMKGFVYRNTGTHGTPVWVAVNNVKDLTLTLEKAEADATTRANNGWRATVGTLKDASVEWQMVYDPADTDFTAIQTAWLTDEPIEFLIMDGGLADNVNGNLPTTPEDAPAAQGLRALCSVLKFTRGEPLEDVMMTEVSIKPLTPKMPQNGLPIPNHIMQQFNDSLGRSWPVKVDIASATRVVGECSIDLLDIREIGENMERLRCEMLLASRVAWSICRLDATQRGISQDAFSEGLQGDALLSFFDALTEGLANFFPSGQRDLLRKMLTKMKTLEALAIAQAEAELEAASTFGNSPSNLPESSE